MTDNDYLFQNFLFNLYRVQIGRYDDLLHTRVLHKVLGEINGPKIGEDIDHRFDELSRVSLHDEDGRALLGVERVHAHVEVAQETLRVSPEERYD